MHWIWGRSWNGGSGTRNITVRRWFWSFFSVLKINSMGRCIRKIQHKYKSQNYLFIFIKSHTLHIHNSIGQACSAKDCTTLHNVCIYLFNQSVLTMQATGSDDDNGEFLLSHKCKVVLWLFSYYKVYLELTKNWVNKLQYYFSYTSVIHVCNPTNLSSKL